LRRHRLVERGQVTIFRGGHGSRATRIGYATQLGRPGCGRWWANRRAAPRRLVLPVGRRRDQRVPRAKTMPLPLSSARACAGGWSIPAGTLVKSNL
jgi:hypothetical protein